MFELIYLTGLILSVGIAQMIGIPLFPGFVLVPILAVPISVGLGIIYDLYRKVFDK